MEKSFESLEQENLQLKEQLHIYEQYQVLLQIQKNLAISLGKAVGLTTILDMIIKTILQIEGVLAGGILLLNELTQNYLLVAHHGFPRSLVDLLSVIEPEHPAADILLNRGCTHCSSASLFETGLGDDNVDYELGVFPISGSGHVQAVLVVGFQREASHLRMGFELLEAISNQIGGVISRAQREELLRKSLEEKKILLREVHHRVKNNLAMISSFISLQESSVTDQDARHILLTLQQKIHSITIIYEFLYKTDNLKSVQFNQYIERLIQQVIETLSRNPDTIDFDFKTNPLEMDIDVSINLGLILSELATNSLKYGLNDRAGTIGLHIEEGASEIRIRYWDSAKAFPKDFSLEDSRGLGARIIIELTSQLEGSFDFTPTESLFVFTFPKNP